jgi:hypothetical protein
MENDNDKAIDFIGIVTEVAKGCNFIVMITL